MFASSPVSATAAPGFAMVRNHRLAPTAGGPSGARAAEKERELRADTMISTLIPPRGRLVPESARERLPARISLASIWSFGLALYCR